MRDLSIYSVHGKDSGTERKRERKEKRGIMTAIRIKEKNLPARKS